MRFAILGPLAVTHDGRPLNVRGRTQRRLLAALLAEPNRTVTSEWLLDMVWGDAGDGGDGRNRLQTAISRLRKELAVLPGDVRLVQEAPGYRLRVGDGELDAFVFERLRLQAAEALEAGDPATAAALSTEALDEWRGRAFGELADERFAHRRATELEGRRLAAEECRIEARLALGHHAELVPELVALVQAHPGHERLRARLVLALYRSDRPDEALDACRSYREGLVDRTGRDPGSELADLERAVLDHDPALDWVSPAGDEAGERGGRRVGPRTFLFTGLDVGPASWDGDGEATAAAARRAHEACVGAAIVSRGGRVFDRAGDGFCAVFDRPVDAVLAAQQAAVALRRASANAGRGLRARMAVHTGEADPQGGAWRGPPVIRVARMRDAAHGGQVLVSAATRELVADDLPEDTGLAGIGAWQFDGLRHPERLYQLTYGDLNHEFPPLRAGVRHTGQLPRYTTAFLGRERHVIDTAAKLGRHQLVTIIGDGGIGKTRLALEVAQRATATDYPDGVWYCDVSQADDAHTLVERAAVARGLVPSSATDLRRELVRSFSAARLLFLFDGCERVRVPVAELVDEILASGSEARVLVTSRARLGVAAEQVVKLDPLPVPRDNDPEPEAAPAVQLLRDRAVRADALVAQTDPHLVELARRLEGLPLAIELAAPRLVTMSAATLVERLERCFETFTGPPGSPARHQTLRATFDWSFDLVSAEARQLFGALSLFRGTWSLETAEAVAAAVDVDPMRVMVLMAELVEQSLVRMDLPAGGTARYGMLDTIRAYAVEHLALTGRYEAVAELHAAHFVDLAERAVRHRRGPDEPAWVSELTVEFDNLRAAYRWSLEAGRTEAALRLVVALADDLLMRERLEIGRWAAELAERPEAADHPLRAEVLGLAANASMLEGRLDEAGRRALDAVAAEERTGAPPSWMARNVLAMLTVAGMIDPGGGSWSDHLDAMDAISDRTDDPFAAALVLWDRALVATFTAEADRGEAPARALLTLGDQHENPSMRSMGLLALGRIAALRDDGPAARELFHAALGAASSAHNTLVTNQTMRSITDLDAHSGDRTATLASLRRIAQRFAESGNVSEQIQTVMSMVDQLVALGALEPAATALGALARTPTHLTVAYRVIDGALAERLAPAARLTALRDGGAMQLHQLVAYLSQVLDDLAGNEGEPVR
jgi:predicted ATPase/DNA-binding SARP family transcriptional activator